MAKGRPTLDDFIVKREEPVGSARSPRWTVHLYGRSGNVHLDGELLSYKTKTAATRKARALAKKHGARHFVKRADGSFE